MNFHLNVLDNHCFPLATLECVDLANVEKVILVVK